MKRWHIEFTAAGMVKDSLGTIAASFEDGSRVYSGTIYANDPDDAFFKVAEAYRGANVRKCYRAME